MLAQGKKKEEKLLLIESGFTLAVEFVLLQTLWSAFSKAGVEESRQDKWLFMSCFIDSHFMFSPVYLKAEFQSLVNYSESMEFWTKLIREFQQRRLLTGYERVQVLESYIL